MEEMDDIIGEDPNSTQPIRKDNGSATSTHRILFHQEEDDAITSAENDNESRGKRIRRYRKKVWILLIRNESELKATSGGFLW
ncbi:hypothetical protein RRG08_060254 [Elysia crispata]|uniref:Uncharacterized protein n=1 Tax=Elysia crispata TaxID=231223 RepID=A0AAE1B962_9GAST|nr:hypothetical protein RRG08_060254 [Elysia crispata]